MAGADDFVEISLRGRRKLAWLRRFLPFENGVPPHDMLNDVMNALPTVLFASSDCRGRAAVSNCIGATPHIKYLARLYTRHNPVREANMAISLAAAAAIGTLVGVTITVGKIGVDYANNENDFERLVSDMKRAAKQNDYVVRVRSTNEFMFFHVSDWKNPTENYAYKNGTLTSSPSSSNSECRVVSFKPRDGWWSNDWLITTWSKRKGTMVKKQHTVSTSECAALFSKKYINGKFAMQNDTRGRLEENALA